MGWEWWKVNLGKLKNYLMGMGKEKVTTGKGMQR